MFQLEMVIVRTIVLFLAGSLLCSCISLERTGEHVDALATDVRDGSKVVAGATVRGAEAVGDSVGTAYRGVRGGFAPPDDAAYGPGPRDYVAAIRRHMLRFEGVSKTASFTFGKPVKAYLNKGLLRGGEVEWQGWLVDLSIETKTPFGQPQVDQYVVSMKDGEIVEVMEGAHAGAFHRLSDDAAPAPAAPRR
jgi:hypothetical protein